MACYEEVDATAHDSDCHKHYHVQRHQDVHHESKSRRLARQSLSPSAPSLTLSSSSLSSLPLLFLLWSVLIILLTHLSSVTLAAGAFSSSHSSAPSLPPAHVGSTKRDQCVFRKPSAQHSCANDTAATCYYRRKILNNLLHELGRDSVPQPTNLSPEACERIQMLRNSTDLLQDTQAIHKQSKSSWSEIVSIANSADDRCREDEDVKFELMRGEEFIKLKVKAAKLNVRIVVKGKKNGRSSKRRRRLRITVSKVTPNRLKHVGNWSVRTIDTTWHTLDLPNSVVQEVLNSENRVLTLRIRCSNCNRRNMLILCERQTESNRRRRKSRRNKQQDQQQERVKRVSPKSGDSSGHRKKKKVPTATLR